MIIKYLDKQLSEAEKIFDYLCLKDKEATSDAIIGFGHFDLGIPRYCAELYSRSIADKIIFTGGIGAGSADFKNSEAIEFKNELLEVIPDFPSSNLILEANSTNTGENILFTKKVLEESYPNLAFGVGIKSAILVCSPYRQRRVWLTCKKHFPNLRFLNCPPTSNFQKELKLFQSKNEDLIQHIAGEIDRIQKYLPHFIAEEKIPEEILESREFLQI